MRVSSPVAKPSGSWKRADGSLYDVARETDGKVTLLYFGYTHCPDVCPLQLMNLAQALRSLGPDTTEQLRVLFITLDPARDTGTALTNWLRGFHPAFVPLTAEPDRVAAELARLRLTPPSAATVPVIDPTHAAAVVAFARDGLGHFLYPESVNPAAWAYDLRKLLRDSVP